MCVCVDLGNKHESNATVHQIILLRLDFSDFSHKKSNTSKRIIVHVKAPAKSEID